MTSQPAIPGDDPWALESCHILLCFELNKEVEVSGGPCNNIPSRRRSDGARDRADSRSSLSSPARGRLIEDQ